MSYIRLLVTDFNASFLFYRDVFALEVIMAEEEWGYAEFLVSEGTRLALSCPRHEMAEIVGTSHLPARASVQDSAVIVFTVETADDAVRSLKERGAHFLTEPTDRHDWGVRTAHLRDPDGNLIEVNSHLKQGG